MLVLAIALGLLAPASASSVVTPSERTITLTRAGGNVVAGGQLDPSDVLDYQINMAGLLETGEAVASSFVAVTTRSATLGFQILQTPPYQIENIDSSNLRIWVSVDASKRSDLIWTKPQPCTFEVTLATDSTPARQYQRTGVIYVVQK